MFTLLSNHIMAFLVIETNCIIYVLFILYKYIFQYFMYILINEKSIMVNYVVNKFYVKFR